MKLHVFPPSPRATKVMALANHLGLDCEIRVVNLFKGEQHQPGFAALNPNERMPVLEDDSFVLWESNAIALPRRGDSALLDNGGRRDSLARGRRRLALTPDPRDGGEGAEEPRRALTYARMIIVRSDR